ncbi:hypothetical protein MIDIC_560011 [Alphaproteobacteria bacterium]
MLYKRTIVETIFDRLEQFQRLWHSMFRSVENAFCNLVACLILYQLSLHKPTSLPLLSCNLIHTPGFTKKEMLWKDFLPF